MKPLVSSALNTDMEITTENNHMRTAILSKVSTSYNALIMPLTDGTVVS